MSKYSNSSSASALSHKIKVRSAWKGKSIIALLMAIVSFLGGNLLSSDIDVLRNLGYIMVLFSLPALVLAIAAYHEQPRMVRLVAAFISLVVILNLPTIFYGLFHLRPLIENPKVR